MLGALCAARQRGSQHSSGRVQRTAGRNPGHPGQRRETALRSGRRLEHDNPPHTRGDTAEQHAVQHIPARRVHVRRLHSHHLQRPQQCIARGAAVGI